MPDRSKHELNYQAAPSQITRGQFRLLLLLVLLLVLMTAQSNYAPRLFDTLKKAWTEHQQAVAHQLALKKTLASEALAGAYTPPPAQVIWEENPGRAGKLLAGGGYDAITPESNEPQYFLDAIPPLARFKGPTTIPDCVVVDGFLSRPAFMHDRRIGNQPPRLVVVFLHGSLLASINQGSNQQPAEPFDAAIIAFRRLSARSYGHTGESGVLTNDMPWTTMLSLQAEENGTVWSAHWAPATQPGNPGKLNIQYHDMLRIFAGQADPADPSHFTIAYELDGSPGTIDGWLKADGSVALEPREGKRIGALWYPHASRGEPRVRPDQLPTSAPQE